jgi:hypothetical protein
MLHGFGSSHGRGQSMTCVGEISAIMLSGLIMILLSDGCHCQLDWPY